LKAYGVYSREIGFHSFERVWGVFLRERVPFIWKCVGVFLRERVPFLWKGREVYSWEKGYHSFEKEGGCIPERKGGGNVFQRERVPFLWNGGGCIPERMATIPERWGVVFQIERLSKILLKGGGGRRYYQRVCAWRELKWKG
jgi:hypothetical protein